MKFSIKKPEAVKPGKVKCESCDGSKWISEELKIECPDCEGAGVIERKKEKEPYDPRKHGVSQTALESWLMCREKARLRYIVGVKPSDKRSFAEGGNLHTIQELIYKQIMSGEVKSPADIPNRVLKIVEWIEGGLERKGKHQTLEKIQPVLDSACVLIPSYFMNYLKDFKEEWTGIEKKFEFEIIPGVKFKGCYDGLFRRKSKDWVFETKFKSHWGDNYSDLLQLDLQVAAYTASISGTVGGTRYNIIRKPQIKRKKEEGRKAFSDRLARDIAMRPEFYFERHDVPISKAEIDSNLRRMKCLVTNFTKWCDDSKKDQVDLMFNSFSCEHKFGVCEFLKNCSSGDMSI